MNHSYHYVVKIFFRVDKKNTLLYLLCSFFIVPFTIAELVLTQKMVSMISNISSTGFSSIIYTFIIALLIVLYINGFLSSLKAISETNLTEYGLYEQERILLDKTLKLSVPDLDNSAVKDLRNKAHRLNLINVLTTYTSFLSNILSLVMLLYLLIYYKSIFVILIAILLLFLNSIIQKWSAKRIESIEQKQTKSKRLAQYLFQLLTNRENIPEIRVYNISAYLKDKYKKIYMRNFNENRNALNVKYLLDSLCSVLFTIINVVCLAGLVLIVSGNHYDIGTYVLLTQILGTLLGLLPGITANYSSIKVIQIQYEQYCEFMKMEEIPVIPRGKQEKRNHALKINFRDVSFLYPGTDTYALKDINLDINAGEKIAIVGKNGSGKSTLIKLILGLYQPTEGSIQFLSNGHELPAHEVEKHTRVVFQDFVHLLRPIRENVAIGRMDCLKEDQVLAGSLEKAHSTIGSDRLDDYIGPEFGGIDISGGQWQTLAIARAYMDDGAMIIFDEATSALDPQAELEQLKSFLTLGKNCTALFITHRLSVAKLVDKIAVIDNGVLVEFGNHKELYENDGPYHQMFDAQSSFYK